MKLKTQAISAPPRLHDEASVDSSSSDNHERPYPSASSSSVSSSTSHDGEKSESGKSGSGSSGSAGTGTGTGMSSAEETHTSNEYKEVERMAKAETARIRFCRLVVIIMILAAGMLVAAGTYTFLAGREIYEYREGYFLFTTAVEDSSLWYMRNMFDAMRDLSETITLSANRTNSTFPYVVVDYFESRARHAREQSGFQAIYWAPVIEDSGVDQWIQFTQDNVDWLYESRSVALATDNADISFRETEDDDDVKVKPKKKTAADYHTTPVPPFLYMDQPNSTLDVFIPVNYSSPYLPIWQLSPPPEDMSFINDEQIRNKYMRDAYGAIQIAREGVLAGYVNFSDSPHTHPAGPEHLAYHQQFAPNITTEAQAYSHPHAALIQPIYSDLNNPHSNIVGLLHGALTWDRYLVGLLPEGVTGVYCVLSNNCGDVYTYKLSGQKATYLGPGDLHEQAFDDTAYTIELNNYMFPNVTKHLPGHCQYIITTYSSAQYMSAATSNTPLAFTIGVAAIFLLVALTFIVYDCFVQQRNNKVITAAARANSILSSLFPKNVRDRLFREKEEEEQLKKSYAAPKSHLNDFLNKGGSNEKDDEEMFHDEKPIADLFPETTILFADIAGFTAWSSVREPAQVFILLETVYHAFDLIAKRRRIFKVETVGDCYVAVTGLPDPRKDHAIAMCRFARDCMHRFCHLTKKLEVTLGPDTGDLELRVGLHSGPVTAGVLRGDRSRFQLFGDTMNTASRMESTGKQGCIQLSEDTASLIIAAGKQQWLTEREERVVAKGKGEVKTFWLSLGSHKSTDGTSSTSGFETMSVHTDSEKGEGTSAQTSEDTDDKKLDLEAEKMSRLVDWNVDVLQRLLKQIVAHRNATKHAGQTLPTKVPEEEELAFGGSSEARTLDEVCEIIHLPTFDAEAAKKQEDIKMFHLEPRAVEQLYRYVANIAQTYNDNPFHNFEHASHVTMSVNKLLSRIIAPDIDYSGNDVAANEAALHDHTYGITSDPLTQFACVFSALIHDVDHTGVPNAQLVKEGTYIAKYYNGRSVAEQNSLDLAWQLLMEDDYKELRHTIYTTDEEFRRFRQLVVNAVMATDIADKDLKVLRNARWAKAFSEARSDDDPKDAINRKATIVIEHLLQASDIAHTMQHWHVYRKWNERFFVECTKAYLEGRAEKDPAEFWYQGEIGFFDFYIIPLARKLKDCGVFGVSSDEYLNYAVRNRQEWEQRGREVVNEMIEVANKRLQVEKILSQSLAQK